MMAIFLGHGEDKASVAMPTSTRWMFPPIPAPPAHLFVERSASDYCHMYYFFLVRLLNEPK